MDLKDKNFGGVIKRKLDAKSSGDLEVMITWKNFSELGPKEHGGAIDLIGQFKLWPYHEFYCKKPLPPLSIAKCHYLHNVVGDTEIRKGEGMELGQLFHKTYLGDSHARIRPFNLGLLWEAFKITGSAPVHLPSAEKGIPTAMVKPDTESKDKRRKHKKHKDKGKERDHTRHKHGIEDRTDKKDKKRNGMESGPQLMNMQHDKRRRRK